VYHESGFCRDRRARYRENVIQVHGVDAAGAVVVARSIRRAQVLAFFAGPCHAKAGALRFDG